MSLANLNRLRELREMHNLSQRALAEALQLDGEEIDPRRISAYELGKTEPDIDMLDRIAYYFGVTVDYLIGRETDIFSLKKKGEELSLSTFGKRIRQCRVEKNISAKELAALVGISQTYLLLIEAGKKIPKMEIAVKILNTLHISADAALMDSLIESYTNRAHYLEARMSALNPETQKLMLDLLEGMIKTLEESQYTAALPLSTSFDEEDSDAK